jgi:hypothetical protein
MNDASHPPAAPAGPSQQERDARLWGMLCHLSALLMLTSVPLAHILGPLVVWLIKRGDDPFINEQGRESLNFQLSMTLWAVLAAIVIFLLTLVLIGVLLWPLFFLWPVVNVIFVVLASIRANRGESYRYPLTIRFLR